MKKLRFENPFAMGNLDDLMNARLTNDVEYLKEWSRKAVKTHETAIHIQLEAFGRLIQIKEDSTKFVEVIQRMLKETHSSNQTAKRDE